MRITFGWLKLWRLRQTPAVIRGRHLAALAMAALFASGTLSGISVAHAVTGAEYPSVGAQKADWAKYGKYVWWVDENHNGRADITTNETDDDEAMSPRGYYYKNCTDFVAWRLNLPRGLGNAVDWRNRLGWATTNDPAPGDIAWWDGHTAGGFGHVAYVVEVINGKARLEEYNWDHNGGYGNARTDRPTSYLRNPNRSAVGGTGTAANESSMFVGRLIHHPNGTVDYVAATGFRYWVPNGDVVNCLGGWGSVINVNEAEFNSLPRSREGDPGGRWADCSTRFVGRMIHHPNGTVDYVAATGQRYWVPNGDVVNCLGGWGSVINANDPEFSSLPRNTSGTNAACSTRQIGRMIHHPNGTVDYVAATGERYYVPSGDIVSCLGGWGSIQNTNEAQFGALPRNRKDTWADCNAVLLGRMIRKESGQVDYITATGQRYWVPNGDIVNCLGGWPSIIYLDTGHFDRIARNPSNTWANCGTKDIR
jgi:surface antigen